MNMPATMHVYSFSSGRKVVTIGSIHVFNVSWASTTWELFRSMDVCLALLALWMTNPFVNNGLWWVILTYSSMQSLVRHVEVMIPINHVKEEIPSYLSVILQQWHTTYIGHKRIIVLLIIDKFRSTTHTSIVVYDGLRFTENNGNGDVCCPTFVRCTLYDLRCAL